MKLPRFRIRTIMIAVAVMAFGIQTAKLYRTSREYRQRVAVSRAQIVTLSRLVTSMKASVEFYELHALNNLENYHTRQEYLRRLEAQKERLIGLQRRLDLERTLEERYERAARRPWLPVQPDPPAPE